MKPTVFANISCTYPIALALVVQTLRDEKTEIVFDVLGMFWPAM